MKKLMIIITQVLLFAFFEVNAQELSCRIQVNTAQIQGTDKTIYDNFNRSVESFINTTQWSNLQLRNNEKIECSMVFIFKSSEGDQHTCELQIQAIRPVYGTTLTTSLLNMREEIKFEYSENKVLNYNESVIDDNLTATLAFWSYIILGLDFDSFSNLGGTPFYLKAKEIANMAQGSLGESWAGQEDKNHWGWINALSDENQTALRQLAYEYHRLGLDEMHKDAEKGRAQITQAITRLKVAKQLKPRSPLLANFLDSKSDELINIYSKSTVQEKNNIYNLLTEIYPASSNRLQGIKTRQQ